MLRDPVRDPVRHAPDGGWEYNAVLIAAVLVITESGPGEFSLDHLFGTEKKELGYALGSAVLGTGAAYATLEAARGAAPAPDAP